MSQRWDGSHPANREPTMPPDVREWCRLVARILRRRGRLAQEAGGSVAITEYSQSEIETSEGPQ